VLRSVHTFGVTSLSHLNETTGLLCLDSKPYPSLRTMLSQLDFIRSYNHTLSSTFSHPSLPLTHHSRNRSLCSSVIPLPTAPNALALSPDETLLAVAAGSDVLIYSTGDNMNLTYTLQGHAGQVTSVEWYPNGEKKLVSGSSVDGTHQEEVVWFWDLNKEDSPTEAKIDLECTATGARAVAAEPLVLQAGRISNQDSGSQAQPSFLTSSQRACVFKRDGSAQVVPLLRLVDICLVYLQSYLASGWTS
jgi:WD40 repeat protein